VDFFDDIIGLHVNGAARMVSDTEMRVDHPHLPSEVAPGRRAQSWVLVRVEEAYIHCSKHIPRLRKLSRVDGEVAVARGKKSDYFTGGWTRTVPYQPAAAPASLQRRNVRSVVLAGAVLVLGAVAFRRQRKRG
jgi:hypothetical protein